MKLFCVPLHSRRHIFWPPFKNTTDLHEQTRAHLVHNVPLRHLALQLLFARLCEAYAEIPCRLRQLPSFPSGDGCNCISGM